MDFENLYLRSLTSIILLISFFIILYFFDSYLFVVTFLIYVIIGYEIYINFKKTSYLLILILYLILSFICIQVYFIYYYNQIFFIYFIFVIITFDTFSYIFGSFFGKKKIFKSISPSKTYMGLFFGIISTLLLGSIVNYYFKILFFDYFIFFTLLIIASSFIGDIIESYFKRKIHIKDSSKFLPGHGGFFDRLDGFIMSSIFLLLFKYYFI